MQNLDDYTLIESYLKGNDASLEALVQRYLKPMYGFVFSYVKDAQVAEDVTQEIFLKVWKNLKKIEKNKNFKSWLYTVAKNTALDYLKKKKSIPFSSFEKEDGRNVLMESLSDIAPLPDKASEMLQDKRTFLQAIGNLSEKYRQVLLLYYYNYLNFREIAEALQEPINTIKSRHRRGLVILKRGLYHIG